MVPAQDSPVVLARTEGGWYVGSKLVPVQVHVSDKCGSAGALAWAIASALDVTSLLGRQVVAVGAHTRWQRIVVCHAAMALLFADSVQLVPRVTAVRIAAQDTDALVLDGACAHLGLSDDPDAIGADAAEAGLRALANARVLTRARVAQRIIATDDSAATVLQVMRASVAEGGEYHHLHALLRETRAVRTEFTPSMLPWIGGVIVARADIEAGVMVHSVQWLERGPQALPDEDAIA